MKGHCIIEQIHEQSLNSQINDTESFQSVTDSPIILYNQANTFWNSASQTPLLFKSQVQWGAVTEFMVVIRQRSNGKFSNRRVLTVCYVSV